MHDLGHLAIAQPHLLEEILFCFWQATDFTVEGSLAELTHAYRRLRPLYHSTVFAGLHTITISFRGNRIQIGSARHQRALIRSFIGRMPNLRRLQLQFHLNLQGGLHHATLDQVLGHMDRLNLDGTILREDTVVDILLFFAIPGGPIILATTLVVQRPIDRLSG